MNRNKKYKDYEKLGSKESIELLHKQISHSTSDKTKQHYNLCTLRDYVEAIYSSMNKSQKKQEKTHENDRFVEDLSHGSCGGFGLFLTFSANGMSDRWDWAKGNESVIFFTGMILSLVFLVVSLERMSIVKHLWKYGVVKFLSSILIGGLIISSGSQASAILNKVFEVDSSVFVYSHSILTGLLFFKILEPIFWLVILSCIAHIFIIGGDIKNDLFNIKPIVYLICSAVIGGYSLNVITNMLNEDDLNLKAYKLAHYLDFSDEIYCYEEDTSKTDKVGVFLGANHNRYLLDNKLNTKDDLRRFIHSTAGESDLEKSKELSFRTCG